MGCCCLAPLVDRIILLTVKSFSRLAVHKTMNQSISVVVPAFNCESSIQKTLTAINQQTYKGRREVIVVDDGSTDKTAAVVQSFPSITYLYQKNAGPASARNRGARAATADFIFFTDSDCLPQPNWIEKTMQGFSSDAIAVVAGSYGIANPENLLARGIHAEILFRHQTLMPDYVKSFGSYNFCIRKKVFEAVGGFNESYPHASGEDNDLSYRILNAGYRIFFKKDSLVDHYHPTVFKKYMREQFRHGFWRVKMYADHPHMAQGDDYTFWKDICEIPLAGFICAGFLFSLFRIAGAMDIFICSLVFLALLEVFFCFQIRKPLNEIFFMAFVLFVRSFFRFFGFSSGIPYFLLKRILK